MLKKALLPYSSGVSYSSVTNTLQMYKIKASAFSLPAKSVSLFSAQNTRIPVLILNFAFTDIFLVGSDISSNLVFDSDSFRSSKVS